MKKCKQIRYMKWILRNANNFNLIPLFTQWKPFSTCFMIIIVNPIILIMNIFYSVQLSIQFSSCCNISFVFKNLKSLNSGKDFQVNIFKNYLPWIVFWLKSPSKLVFNIFQQRKLSTFNRKFLWAESGRCFCRLQV